MFGCGANMVSPYFMLGDKVWMSDPQGTFDESRLHLAEKIIMIAAGSGKWPMTYGGCGLEESAGIAPAGVPAGVVVVWLDLTL